jgi:hypothetical protein
MVTSWRTNCSQISYFFDGARNRFARLPTRVVSDMTKSSERVRRTRRMLSDRHADLYREVRRKTDRGQLRGLCQRVGAQAGCLLTS